MACQNNLTSVLDLPKRVDKLDCSSPSIYYAYSSVKMDTYKYFDYGKYIHSLDEESQKYIIKLFDNYVNNGEYEYYIDESIKSLEDDEMKLNISSLVPEIVRYLYNNHDLNLSIIPKIVIENINENRIKSARK